MKRIDLYHFFVELYFYFYSSVRYLSDDIMIKVLQI